MLRRREPRRCGRLLGGQRGQRRTRDWRTTHQRHLIGAPGCDNNAGAAYLVYGGTTLTASLQTGVIDLNRIDVEPSTLITGSDPRPRVPFSWEPGTGSGRLHGQRSTISTATGITDFLIVARSQRSPAGDNLSTEATTRHHELADQRNPVTTYSELEYTPPERVGRQFGRSSVSPLNSLDLLWRRAATSRILDLPWHTTHSRVGQTECDPHRCTGLERRPGHGLSARATSGGRTNNDASRSMLDHAHDSTRSPSPRRTELECDRVRQLCLGVPRRRRRLHRGRRPDTPAPCPDHATPHSHWSVPRPSCFSRSRSPRYLACIGGGGGGGGGGGRRRHDRRRRGGRSDPAGAVYTDDVHSAVRDELRSDGDHLSALNYAPIPLSVALRQYQVPQGFSQRQYLYNHPGAKIKASCPAATEP